MGRFGRSVGIAAAIAGSGGSLHCFDVSQPVRQAAPMAATLKRQAADRTVAFIAIDLAPSIAMTTILVDSVRPA
jgi:hypothetical protein